MSRTLLTTYQLAENNYSVQPGDLAFTFASDFLEGNYFAPSGNDVLLAQNTNSVAHNFTALTTPDHLGRVGDLTYSVPANSIVAIEFSVLEGWLQDDGFIYVTPGDTHILFAVLRHQ